MNGMFRRLLKMLRREDPASELRGAPAKARLKIYSAQSGYIFHYYYEGRRETAQTEEYCFRISCDRKIWFHGWVHVARNDLMAWSLEHGRTLSRQEVYGIAKLALFDAFDSREEPEQMRRPVVVGEADVSRHLGALGVD
jgi:hypothetical protein